MDKINDGGPAFPCEGGDLSGLHAAPGMSVRDYFAIHADQPGAAEIVQAAGLVYSANQVWKDEDTPLGSFNGWYDALPSAERFRLYAKVRYAIADAMLAAREAQP